ncbi:MAG: hypothetical protein WCE29_12025, partial [Mycobacterium sp.]
YRQLEQGIVSAYEDAGATMACNMMEPSALEGVQAFIEKRPPSWLPSQCHDVVFVGSEDSGGHGAHGGACPSVEGARGTDDHMPAAARPS